MQENLFRMKHAVTEWLIKDGLLGDGQFMSIEKWRSRDEKYLDDAQLVLIIDGCSLYTMLNFGGDTSEFDDLIESFGFWYELGHSWSIGFYPIDGYDFSPSTGTYSEKLRDPRWQRKAKAVKDRANNLCQDCGSAEPLDAHHCYYTNMRQGFEPWEYPLSALRALCRTCHEARDRTEIRMRAFSASLTQVELDNLRTALDHALYWFRPCAVSQFLSALGPDERHLQASLEMLKAGRTETD
ncbi:MAG: HNH endonuclease [Methylobacter sp.]